MAKVKFTKGELKRQRDSLQQFQHYLPILLLKKQQLQIRIGQIRRELEQKQATLRALEEEIVVWQGLLADPGVDIKKWVLPETIITEDINVAGAVLPVFKEARFHARDYDLYVTPLWIDAGIDALQSYMMLLSEIHIIERQIDILAQELRITTQRVNLFEKVKVPECMEHIRVIRIYLGDQQANAVGISKVAKRKIAVAQEGIFA